MANIPTTCLACRNVLSRTGNTAALNMHSLTVEAYRAWCDACRLAGTGSPSRFVEADVLGVIAFFHLPVPESWPEEKNRAVDGRRHRQAVPGDLNLGERDPVGLALFRLGLVNAPGGIRDVQLAAGKLLEAAARPGGAHRHLDARADLLELLGGHLRHGKDRAGAAMAVRSPWLMGWWFKSGMLKPGSY